HEIAESGQQPKHRPLSASRASVLSAHVTSACSLAIHPLSFRAKQADSFRRFAPAKRSACAVEESLFLFPWATQEVVFWRFRTIGRILTGRHICGRTRQQYYH